MYSVKTIYCIHVLISINVTRLFILSKVMDTFQTAQDNPPETLQTLLTYEKMPGQAQRFLGTVHNFLYLHEYHSGNTCSVLMFVSLTYL